ncbi:MAG: Mth938-like domain-containing protein [Gammaproteobacteria bacterium]|nr:Mth938-like domain-containing protein [Gammaproteobacteria bacterium]MCW8909874.1 Mth938-like domain-containing protein [Gammaproteobacteria bacterium]MCW9005088.1 Mth938-like domain-containing protein [Gammaproteobacteria bacterium]MCW9055606.1 Mth938-like domain-containing protein [Gammaproteobacteria bacterium]
MKFSEDFNSGSQVIDRYDDNSITINEKMFTQSLIVSNFQIIENWPVSEINDLSNQSLQAILELQPEVIIIGTGKQILFPRPENYSSIINMGIGIEFMNTGAACRTYNVLLSEDRKVAAGIIIS